MARYYRYRRGSRLTCEKLYPNLDDAMRSAYNDYVEDAGWLCDCVEEGDDVFFFDDVFDYWLVVGWLKPVEVTHVPH